jgi:hypothetical protein
MLDWVLVPILSNVATMRHKGVLGIAKLLLRRASAPPQQIALLWKIPVGCSFVRGVPSVQPRYHLSFSKPHFPSGGQRGGRWEVVTMHDRRFKVMSGIPALGKARSVPWSHGVYIGSPFGFSRRRTTTTHSMPSWVRFRYRICISLEG